MAVDRKADYVGNHGGAYTDENGMSRQFTYVDHDRKLSSRVSGGESKEYKAQKKKKLEDLKAQIKKRNDEKIEQILCLPAINAVMSHDDFVDAQLYEEFITRSADIGITWNEEMVRSACTINHELCRNLHIRVWRYTVKPEFWNEDMSHEDILNGEWKKLT